jgi:hypothetical protein
LRGDETPTTVALEGRDDAGVLQLERELAVGGPGGREGGTNGVATVLELPAALDGAPVTWCALRLREGDGLRVAPRFTFAGGAPVPWQVAAEAHRHVVIAGPSAGLGGHLVSLVNPLGTPARARLRRTVDGALSDDETLELPPFGHRQRAWSLADEGRVELVIDGDPLVVQALRWDPLHVTVR